MMQTTLKLTPLLMAKQIRILALILVAGFALFLNCLNRPFKIHISQNSESVQEISYQTIKRNHNIVRFHFENVDKANYYFIDIEYDTTSQLIIYDISNWSARRVHELVKPNHRIDHFHFKDWVAVDYRFKDEPAIPYYFKISYRKEQESDPGLTYSVALTDKPDYLFLGYIALISLVVFAMLSFFLFLIIRKKKRGKKGELLPELEAYDKTTRITQKDAEANSKKSSSFSFSCHPNPIGFEVPVSNKWEGGIPILIRAKFSHPVYMRASTKNPKSKLRITDSPNYSDYTRLFLFENGQIEKIFYVYVRPGQENETSNDWIYMNFFACRKKIFSRKLVPSQRFASKNLNCQWTTVAAKNNSQSKSTKNENTEKSPNKFELNESLKMEAKNFDVKAQQIIDWLKDGRLNPDSIIEWEAKAGKYDKLISEQKTNQGAKDRDQRKLQDIEKSWKKERDKLTEEIEIQKNKLSELFKNLDEKEQTIFQQKEKLINLEKRMADKEQQIEALTANMSEQSPDTLSTAGVKGDYNRLKTEIEEKELVINKLTAELNRAQTERDRLTHLIEKKELELEELQTQANERSHSEIFQTEKLIEDIDFKDMVVKVEYMTAFLHQASKNDQVKEAAGTTINRTIDKLIDMTYQAIAIEKKDLKAAKDIIIRQLGDIRESRMNEIINFLANIEDEQIKSIAMKLRAILKF